MSHRGEGAIYRDGQDRPSPQDAAGRPRTRSASDAGMAQEGVPKASAPPPPPPLPTGDSSIPVPRMAGEKSQMSEKLDKAVDARRLSAHDVVHTLRLQLEQIFEPPSVDQVDLSETVNSRVIIIHGPTGTGKSTVIPWEAMRWLEEHCSQRGRKAGRVICSQQRRKVTISLAQRRHGEVGSGPSCVKGS